MDIKTKLRDSTEDRQATLLYDMVCKDQKLVTAKKKNHNFSYSSHTVV